MSPHKVLIVTDGLLSPAEPSIIAALRKQIQVHRNTTGPWLDLRMKLQILERIVPAKLYLKSSRIRKEGFYSTVARLLHDRINLGAPELTEVVLMTLLEREGIEFEARTYAELAADPAERERALGESGCVFASATMLRGMPEVKVVGRLLKRNHNRVVLGGALTGALHDKWPGVSGIDLLAVGYGELLVPALADWIRSGYRELEPPLGGRLERRGETPILHSGSPASRSLDGLVRPDWTLAETYHGRRFPLVHYESVRGCPYRCQFCNYPYLFADDVFRTKSAQRIASDWIAYASNGARIINCLDSLFTVPRKRLLELCDALEGRGVRWICYARADDLAHPGVVERMVAAGCAQVQIGIESGSQLLLDNMRKQCTVESNLAAMRICREHGLSTVVSVIIGYPGETRVTVKETLDHLREGRPDFYYAAPFSVLIEGLPALSPESRSRFGLRTNGVNASSPYWSHDTMDAAEALEHVGSFNDVMIDEEVSLEASLFYAAMPDYRRSTDRADLLSFQKASGRSRNLIRGVLKFAGRRAQTRLRNDIRRVFRSPAAST